MDLSTLTTQEASEQGAEMPVLNFITQEPITDGKGVPSVIRLAGMDSKRYREHNRKVQNRKLRNITRGAKNVTWDAEEAEKDNLDLAVACTLSWSGIGWKGEDLPCTPENVQMLYTQLPWLREQVEQFITARENFFTKPPSSSSNTTVSPSN
jgi:hypothetical protein